MKFQHAKKIAVLFATILFFSLEFSSCYYDVDEQLYPKPTDVGINCDTTNATYSGKVAPMIQTSCISCHSAVANQGSVTLETYNDVLAYAQNGKLLGTINHAAGHNPMPLGGAKLSDCVIANVSAWINAGSPNN